jgi:hypothetical protein
VFCLRSDAGRVLRPGRTNLILVPNPGEGERWLAAHSHMSPAKGVPAESHATRAVKAR